MGKGKCAQVQYTVRSKFLNSKPSRFRSVAIKSGLKEPIGRSLGSSWGFQCHLQLKKKIKRAAGREFKLHLQEKNSSFDLVRFLYLNIKTKGWCFTKLVRRDSMDEQLILLLLLLREEKKTKKKKEHSCCLIY